MGINKTKNKGINLDTNEIKMEVINGVITIKDICEGYIDNSFDEEGGVTSMNGRLNIRPRYQRTYIVDDNVIWKEKLINSIICGYPINRIYIGVDKENIKNKKIDECDLEMLDGQQRSITICNFINDRFSITIDGKYQYWSGLDEEYQQRILNYNLDVTYCIGNESSRIKWFKRINQPNSLLTEQELRNSTYVGTWLEDAKKYFCATSNKTIKEINDKEERYCITNYTTLKAIDRCEFLELALDWVSYNTYDDLRKVDDKDERICRYMAQHQKDSNAEELIKNTHEIIDWIIDVFWQEQDGYPNVSTFKKVDWGRIFCEYGAKKFTIDDKKYITERCLSLADPNSPHFNKPHGAYEWVLRGEKESEKNTYLDIKDFNKNDIFYMYTQQGGIDPIDGNKYDLKEMEAHHIKSRRSGGLSSFDNIVLLHKDNHKKLHADSFISPENLKEKRDDLRKKNGYNI